jgi:hypothetical protein
MRFGKAASPLLARDRSVPGGRAAVAISSGAQHRVLWQSGNVWIWAVAAGVLGLLTWPLSRLVRNRGDEEAWLALGDLAEPSRSWNAIEREAWTEVLAIADATSRQCGSF